MKEKNEKKEASKKEKDWKIRKRKSKQERKKERKKERKG